MSARLEDGALTVRIGSARRKDANGGGGRSESEPAESVRDSG